MRLNNQRTIYSTLPVQSVISLGIKSLIFKAYRVNKLKAIWYLWKAFRTSTKLPEPIKENTWHPNTHNLIDLRDWLWERCHLDNSRMGLVRGIINFVIILYDFDSPWRWIIDSAREKIMSMDWEKRGYGDKRNYDWWQEK